MIIRYRENSEVTEIHSQNHGVCTHQDELEPGWECCCTDCKCEAVVTVEARYAYTDEMNHGVIVHTNGTSISLPPDMARALASALSFAAIDAETLDKDFPL